MNDDLQQDVAAVQNMRGIPTMLDIICQSTGMGFAAVARVTRDRWVACSVRDRIGFGLKPGGELAVETMICDEIRRHGETVVIDHADRDPLYKGHHTMARYGLQSYISVPIRLADGGIFGTLCALDRVPRILKTAATIDMVGLFADVIGFQLNAIDRRSSTEDSLFNERKIAALREEFIAVLGHDLRNPLAAIDSGMRLLRKTPLADKAQHILGLMQDSAGRMARLIDDVMDFARGRLGGGLPLDRGAPLLLEPLLRQIVAEFHTSTPAARIDCDFALPDPVHCDPTRIGQLFSNLLGNAIRHAPPGTPVCVAAATKGGHFTLSIANTGAPIPPAMRDVLFEPFARGLHQPTQKGLGLGLYIAREIARAHGGTLEVASSEAETRFIFRMRLDAADNTA